MIIINQAKHFIGKDGNSISISRIKNDWYMLEVSDHYDDNHIGLFMHKDDLRGLSDFINTFLSTDNAN